MAVMVEPAVSAAVVASVGPAPPAWTPPVPYVMVLPAVTVAAAEPPAAAASVVRAVPRAAWAVLALTESVARAVSAGSRAPVVLAVPGLLRCFRRERAAAVVVADSVASVVPVAWVVPDSERLRPVSTVMVAPVVRPVPVASVARAVLVWLGSLVLVSAAAALPVRPAAMAVRAVPAAWAASAVLQAV